MEENKEASLSKLASWGNSALNPDLSVDLMNNIDVLLMRHKMKHPRFMEDADRIKLIQAELKAQKEGKQ
jgi:hypothetical protein